MQNLSVNQAANEEEALNLLFLGDTHRVVAETPMNDASTRSHCIFVVWIESSVSDKKIISLPIPLVQLFRSHTKGQVTFCGSSRQ